MMNNCDTTNLINRLKRIEGQVRGIQRMIFDGEADCKSVINQMTAVRSAMNNLMGIVMTENLKNIVEYPEKDDQLQQKKLADAIDMIVKK